MVAKHSDQARAYVKAVRIKYENSRTCKQLLLVGGFPELGIPLRFPIIWIIIYWGLYWGPLFWAKLQMPGQLEGLAPAAALLKDRRKRVVGD